ncbi:MAG: hypothetical protein M3O23_13120 [Actinomycetota bacterium]|nr:hypothetical protein [Actinomycetota bacterium]
MERSGVTPHVGAETADVAELATGSGPFLSIYLTTEATVENAAQRAEVRWRSVRDSLAADGAPGELLDVVDPLVADAHLQGEGLGVVVRADGAILVEHHPRAPALDRSRWAPLPVLVPLLGWRQSTPPHVVVTADRKGADIVAVGREGPDVRREAGGDDYPIRKVSAGGWSQRRYEERAENTWAQNAEDAARQVAALAERVRARLIVVAGDVRAVTLLRDALPAEFADRVREAGGGRSADGSGDLLAAQVGELVDQAVAADTAALLEKFDEERGQGDRAADGVEATLRALAASQVEVLLVHDDPDDDRPACFGADPRVVATNRADLASMGVDDPGEGPVVDVAVRAALATGAGIRIIPRDVAPAEGLGAILRW